MLHIYVILDDPVYPWKDLEQKILKRITAIWSLQDTTEVEAWV